MENNPAGFWVRLGALFLDGLFINLIAWLLGFMFITSWQNGITEIIQFLYLLVVPIVWYGYTIGKRACTIRIIHMDGSNVRFWTMIKRNVVGGLLYVLPTTLPVIYLALTLDTRIWAVFSFQTVDFPASTLSNNALTLLTAGLLLSFALLLVSAFMVGVSKSRRSLHDLIAGTYVTRDTPNETEMVYREKI